MTPQIERLNRCLLRPFSFLRSWTLEVGAVLGLSVGSNLLVAKAVPCPSGAPAFPRRLYPWAVLAWIGFGILLLWCSKLYRDREVVHIRDGKYGAGLSKQLLQDLAAKWWSAIILIVATVLLVSGVLLLLWDGDPNG